MAADGYSGLSRLRRFNGVALLAMAVMELVYGVTSWQYLGVLNAEVPEAELDARWQAFERMAVLVDNYYMIVSILCLILGGAWIYAAVKNAALLDPGPDRISPGWAIGWHFVPFANLFKPFQAMKQTYNSSRRPPRPLDAPVDPALRWWWALWLLTLLPAVGSSVLFSSSDSDHYAAAALIEVIGTPFMVVSIYLWWTVITLISDLQSRARRTLLDNTSQKVIQ